MVLDIQGSNALIFNNNIYVSNGTRIAKYNPDITIISEIDLLYNIIDVGYKPPYIYVMGDYDITVLDSNLNIITNFHNDTLNPFENFLVAKNENSIYVANRYRAFKVNMDTLTVMWSVDYPVCYESAQYNTLASTMSLDDTDIFYTSIQRYDVCSRYRFFYPDGTIRRDIGYNTAGNYYTEPIILNDTHYFIGMNTGSGGTAPKPIQGYNRTTDVLEYTLSANNYHLCMFYDNNRIYACSANSSAFGYYDLADLSFTNLGGSPFWFNTRSFMTASASTLYTGIYTYNPYVPGEVSGNNIIYNFGDLSSSIYANNAGYKIAIGGNYLHSPTEFYNGSINYLNKQDSYNGIFPYNISILNLGGNILRLDVLPLIVTATANPDQVNSGDTSQITVHVADETGLGIDNANIILSTTDGTINPSIGLADTNGDFISSYSAPTVTAPQIFSISVTASKTGYVNGIGTVQITVNPIVLVLTSIEVNPPSANIIVGNNQQFIAICRDQNNDPMTCPAIAWSTSDTNIGVIDPTGLFTGIAEGTVTVIATGDSIIGTAVVNVTPVVSAGLSSTAGAILLGGLLLGTVFLSRRCKNYSTRERCEKEGCQWMGDRCFTR